MVSIKNKIKTRMSFSKKLPEKLIINFAWPNYPQFLLNLNLPFQEFGKLFGSLRRSLERSGKSLQEFGLSLAES